MWTQHLLTLPARSYGLHEITGLIAGGIPELKTCEAGILHVFIQHTSASLTIMENADPDVPLDLSDAIDKLAPVSAGYRHSIEGPDDMPAHIKSALLGSSLTIPVRGGSLCLGTWQGLYLYEHRYQPQRRKLVLTMSGQ